MGFGDKLKGLRDQAQHAVAENRDKIQGAVQNVGEVANAKTHGKYADKIAKVGDRVTQGVDRISAEDEAAATAPAPTGGAAPAPKEAAAPAPTEAAAPAPTEPAAPAAAPAEPAAPASAPSEAGSAAPGASSAPPASAAPPEFE